MDQLSGTILIWGFIASLILSLTGGGLGAKIGGGKFLQGVAMILISIAIQIMVGVLLYMLAGLENPLIRICIFIASLFGAAYILKLPAGTSVPAAIFGIIFSLVAMSVAIYAPAFIL